MIVDMASIFIAVCAFVVSVVSVMQAKKRTRGNVLLGCLNSYLKIAEHRDKALIDNNPQLAKVYYRELLDLLWSEYRMWQSGLVPNHIMRVWALSNYRNLKQGQIEITTSGAAPVIVTYREVWDELRERKYFDETDSFTIFLKKVESGDIDGAMKVPDTLSS